MGNKMKLYDILRKRLAKFSYEDLKFKRPSGMTRMQEWLRIHGIREETDERKGYIAVPHPTAWTKGETIYGKSIQLLLVPTELAIKIETLGHIP